MCNISAGLNRILLRKHYMKVKNKRKNEVLNYEHC